MNDDFCCTSPFQRVPLNPDTPRYPCLTLTRAVFPPASYVSPKFAHLLPKPFSFSRVAFHVDFPTTNGLVFAHLSETSREVKGSSVIASPLPLAVRSVPEDTSRTLSNYLFPVFPFLRPLAGSRLLLKRGEFFQLFSSLTRLDRTPS